MEREIQVGEHTLVVREIEIEEGATFARLVQEVAVVLPPRKQGAPPERRVLWSHRVKGRDKTWVLFDQNGTLAMVSFTFGLQFDEIVLLEALVLDRLGGKTGAVVYRGKTVGDTQRDVLKAKRAAFAEGLKAWAEGEHEKRRAATRARQAQKVRAGLQELSRQRAVRLAELDLATAAKKAADAAKLTARAARRRERIVTIMARPQVRFWSTSTGKYYFGIPVRGDEAHLVTEPNTLLVLCTGEGEDPHGWTPESVRAVRIFGGERKLMPLTIAVTFTRPTAEAETVQPLRIDAVYLVNGTDEAHAYPFIPQRFSGDEMGRVLSELAEMGERRVALESSREGDQFTVFMIENGGSRLLKGATLRKATDHERKLAKDAERAARQ